jgi:hypothetical protein
VLWVDPAEIPSDGDIGKPGERIAFRTRGRFPARLLTSRDSHRA